MGISNQHRRKETTMKKALEELVIEHEKTELENLVKEYEKTELEKLIEEYGITSEYILCGKVSGLHMPETWPNCEGGSTLSFNKFIFTLRVRDYSDSDTDANHIEPGGPGFFDGYQYRGLALPDPTTADLMHSYLTDYVDESFEDWCNQFGFSTDSRRALQAYEQCKEGSKRLKAFINDQNKLARLLLAAQDY